MANSISVTTYTMRIGKKGKTDTENVSNFDGGKDLLDIIFNVLKEAQNLSVELQTTVKKFAVSNDLQKHDRVIDTIVEVGAHGYTAALRDVKSNEVSYNRKTTDAEMLPLYVRFFVPKGQKYAIFAVQNFSEIGCKTPISELLMDYFDKNHADYSLRIRNAVPSGVIEGMLKNGLVKELRFVNHGIPKDIAEKVGATNISQTSTEMQISLKAKRGFDAGFSSYVQGIFSGNNDSSLLELDNFETNNFKVIVDVGGRNKTLTYKKFVRVNSRVEVSGDVELGIDGHPIRTSIENICSAIIMRIDADINTPS